MPELQDDTRLDADTTPLDRTIAVIRAAIIDLETALTELLDDDGMCGLCGFFEPAPGDVLCPECVQGLDD